MKRKGDQDRSRGDNAERRRRQFEDSRGLWGRPELPLDEEGEPDTPGAPSDRGEAKEKGDGAGGK
jgi:hypothetical protein